MPAEQAKKGNWRITWCLGFKIKATGVGRIPSEGASLCVERNAKGKGNGNVPVACIYF